MYAARCCDAPLTRRRGCLLHVAAMRRPHGGSDAPCTMLRCDAHTAGAMYAARCGDAPLTRRR
eukprot:5116281-Prymnesium_polylepis.1